MRLKVIHLFNSTVIYSTPKNFRTASNLLIETFNVKHSNQKEGSPIKKNSKPESSESCNKSDPSAKPNTDEHDFSDKLIKWAMQNNISYFSFSKLLKVLSEHGIENIPKNSRALLKAKEEEIKVSAVPPGVYTHFGLEKNLKNLISSLTAKNLLNETNLNVSIFIDNLPLSKFTQRGLWVILGSLEGFLNNILFIGAYHGYSRPKNPNLFLSEFITEAKQLCEYGLDIGGVMYNIKIKRLICDAPAKAFVLNIKDYTGYSSCTKCKTVGQFKDKKMCFLEKSIPRADEDFENSDLYQSGKTNLLEIPHFGVVSNVTLDYMHLVCLGVVKKLLSIWLSDAKYWVCETSASNMIKALAPDYPCEFQRKPKSFRIFSRWNGSEFRQFLLYYGPVVLRNNLKVDYFNHFLQLHVACRLLCTEISPENINLGRELLNTFVEKYKYMYKTEHITHNFHGLYHLADECASHGTLDGFSAFPFEKFLLQLRNSMERSRKRSIPHTILKESYDSVFTRSLAKLTGDKYKVGKKLKITDTNQFKNFFHFEKLSVKNSEIVPGTKGDKYVILKNNKIIEVTNVLETKEKSNKTLFVAGREFSSFCNFYSEPFQCLKLNIYVVGEVSDTVQLWPVDIIDKKCMKVAAGNNETVMIGLLNENF